MKKLIVIAIVMASISFTACNNNSKKIEGFQEQTSEQFSCPMHPEVIGNKGDKCSECGMELSVPVKNPVESHQHNEGDHHSQDGVLKDSNQRIEPEVITSSNSETWSSKTVVKNYLALKNALTKDDAKAAASAGKLLFLALKSANTTLMNEIQKKEFLDIADDAKEHAEHIGENGDKIAHQREHFILLSKDIRDLLKVFRAEQTLYQDFCPMANEGKGAIWLSETKEIKNPFYGSKMISCGNLQKKL